MVQAPDKSHDLAQPIVQAPSEHHSVISSFGNEWGGGNQHNAGPGATDRIQRRDQNNMNGNNMNNIGNFDYELAYFSNQAQNNKNKSQVKDVN